MKTTIYTLTSGKTMAGMAAEVESFLKVNRMNVQKLELKEESYIIQGRDRDGKLFQFMGSDKAITVKIRKRTEDTVIVEIGEGKWLDKVGGVVVGWLVAWPVLLLTAMSVYDQYKLPEKIKDRIQKYLYPADEVKQVPAACTAGGGNGNL